MGLDPIRASRNAYESYLRYLETAFPLNDITLSAQFRTELSEPGRFVKGPYLEATPPFETGASISDLVAEGLLSGRFATLCGDSLRFDRPLYRHQESAIRRAIGLRRNFIVATGTGSGKTETFLLPILNHLLREEEAGTLTPGVRALLLYPMNALANDQLKRLRRMLAGYPSITFGRYTGETKGGSKEAVEHFRKNYPSEPLIANELHSRVEMRATPPHILLTNYAMLEYLLLRPEDCEFFDGPKAGYWRFLVLDEVHVYNGATGIEMAMLLRRLRERVVRSERGRLQSLATSATLGRGADDFPEIVNFAERLFDESFEWDAADESRQDVVRAARLSLTQSPPTWGSPKGQLYPTLRDLLSSAGKSVTDYRQIANRFAIPRQVLEAADAAYSNVAGSEGPHAFLYALLEGDGNLRLVRQRLQTGAKLLSGLAKDVFGDGKDENLVGLVDLAVAARRNATSLPLLPARYHLFIRALEGAFIQLAPTRQLKLERAESSKVGEGSFRVFELASCRNCGQPYLVGELQNGKLVHPSAPVDDRGRRLEYFLLQALDTDTATADEDEEVASGETELAGAEAHYVCGKCGRISSERVLFCDCGEREQIFSVMRVRASDGQVNHCPACGSRRPSVVQRFLTGQDAPPSVLATSLYQDMPGSASSVQLTFDTPSSLSPADDDDEWGLSEPSVGAEAGHAERSRKLLTFSDSRQDAAFFACYLGRTYDQILRRRLITLALERHPGAVEEGWKVTTLAEKLVAVGEEFGLFPPRFDWRTKLAEAWKWLLLEVLAFDRRNSLEGLGILAFSVTLPAMWTPPTKLMRPPWSLSEHDACKLMSVLLDSFRHHGAITFPDGVRPDDECFAPRNREHFFRVSGANPKRGIFAWCPAPKKQNRRFDFLARLYRNRSRSEAPADLIDETLQKLWAILTRPSAPFSEAIRQESVKGEGVAYRYDCRFLQISQLNDGWHRCDRCGGVTTVNIHGICPTYRCNGTLRDCTPAKAFASNHYAMLYRDLKPIPMTVKEHTAQLTSEAAAALQEEFVQNKVNVLSCSTTFELGVDVGELESVLLRNVPPEAANYVQRAGRAGRRADSTAFAVTYCQRRSHDLTYFQTPERMIEGTIEPPHFELLNEKIIRRHVFSVALAAFFRDNPKLFGTVESFFFPAMPAPRAVERLAQALSANPAGLQESLRRVVPADLHEQLGIDDWTWVLRLVEAGTGVLWQADSVVCQDVARLEEVRSRLVAEGKPSDYILRTINTVKDKELIGFLANHNVLPKYGFPVDVVDLQLMHHGVDARKLELQRDLRIAIAEYAPGSEVVAGGWVWRSRALKRLQNMEWPRFRYGVCKHCGRYHRCQFDTEDLPDVCGCGEPLMQTGRFVIPIFGFQTAAEAPREPTDSRPDRSYSTRVFFVEEGADDEAPQQLIAGPVGVESRFSRSGTLAVLNKTGFKICHFCGFAKSSLEQEKSAAAPHAPPWSDSATCSGTLQHWNLGHEFNTDVVMLQFSANGDESLWQSVLYAVLEGASQALSVKRRDLDGCLYRHHGLAAPPALVLYDDVPGGAGHARRIHHKLGAVLAAAADRVDGRCGCGGGSAGIGDTSCYGCLRNYSNQWTHHELKRGLALQFLLPFQRGGAV